MKTLRTFTALLYALFFVSSSAFARKEWVPVNSKTPLPGQVTLLSSDIKSTSLKIEIGGFYKRDLITPAGNAYSISLEDASPILKAGSPDLPKITVPIVIPDGSTMKAEVVSFSFVDFPGMEIAPSKGNFNKRDKSLIGCLYVWC